MDEFQKRAEEAALWIMEMEDNPPAMTEHNTEWGKALQFVWDGLLFEYRPTGNYYEDNPWRTHNLRKTHQYEGLVVIAKCPRHGGVRYSRHIATHRLTVAEWIGKVVPCRSCSGSPAVAGPNRAEVAPSMPYGYCADCAEKNFRIPRSSWWKEPLYYTEDDVRGLTRRDLKDVRTWAKDVECDKCVTVMYANGGSFVDTYPRLVRTYERK